MKASDLAAAAEALIADPAHYLPPHPKTIAHDPEGRPCWPEHPRAVRFALKGAIDKATLGAPREECRRFIRAVNRAAGLEPKSLIPGLVLPPSTRANVITWRGTHAEARMLLRTVRVHLLREEEADALEKQEPAA